MSVMKNILNAIWNGWKKFGRILGRVNTEIILFIFYFLIFTPVGLISKLFRHDPLKLHLKKQTNWNDAKIGQFDIERAKRQS